MRAPFFRENKKRWFVKLSDGREIRLGADKEEAYKKWAELLASRCDNGPNATVLGLLDSFMEEVKNQVSGDRKKYIQSIVNEFSDEYGTKLVVDLTVNNVLEWLQAERIGQKEGSTLVWSSNSQRNALAVIKRAWKRAHEKGHITANILAELKLPEIEYRDQVLPIDAHAKLINHLRQRQDSKPFALYLIASRCGARPQQIRDVGKAEVTKDLTRWVFKNHKTRKKTKKALTVYLSPCLQTLTRILLAAGRTDHLFLNANGEPWKSDTVTQRIDRLRKRLGLPDNFVVYVYRHSFATNMLVNGSTAAVVAKLMGHKDTRMVTQVYGHLEHHEPHLLEAVAKTSQPS